MLITLKNDQLTVTIDTLGAQLTSVVDREGTERIWRADPAVWGRHAPLLFPIIGRLKDGAYTLGGQDHKISQHGFARDSEFELVRRTEHEAVFRLSDAEETRKVYPSAFTLEVAYTLDGEHLIKRHRVKNQGDGDMYYELGGHDGFAAPLFPGETMSDYFLEFPGLTELNPYGMDESCMITPKGDRWPLLEGGLLPLPPRVLGLDTVVLDDLPRRAVSLIGRKHGRRVTLEFEQFDYLGIWTKPQEADTGYVCIEPWTTLPDATFVGRGLEDKPGIRRLAPGEEEILAYTTVFSC